MFLISKAQDNLFLFFVCLLAFGFSRQDFAVAIKPVLELALVDQVGLELTGILLPLPPGLKAWATTANLLRFCKSAF